MVDVVMQTLAGPSAKAWWQVDAAGSKLLRPGAVGLPTPQVVRVVSAGRRLSDVRERHAIDGGPVEAA